MLSNLTEGQQSQAALIMPLWLRVLWNKRFLKACRYGRTSKVTFSPSMEEKKHSCYKKQA